MFDAIRNWWDVRAAMKDERRLRAGQAILNTVVVLDKLKHINEMFHVGQLDYATAALQEVLAQFPAEAAELPQTASVLIDLNRYEEAEQLILHGVERNPDSTEFALLFCDIADRRGDTAEQLQRWAAFRRRYPATAIGFSKEAAALRAAGQIEAADAVLAEGVRIAPDDLMLALEYGRLADSRQVWPEAIRRWTVVRDTFNHSLGCIHIAGALVEQGLLEEAEVELEEGRRRFPTEARLGEDQAVLAERRGDLDAALEYWAILRREFPQVARGYNEALRLLRQRGDDAAADALVAEAAARAPGDLQLQRDSAMAAERAGDWAEAARRWGAMRGRFPDELAAFVQGAAALRRIGKAEEAEQVLAEAGTTFPAADEIRQQLAQLAEDRGDWQLAAQRWQAVVSAQPGASGSHAALARALERSGQPAAADAALQAAIAQLPDEAVLYADHASLLTRLGQSDLATARWAAARQRFGPQAAPSRSEAGWLRGQGRLDEAKAVLTDAIRHAPHNIDLLHDLGHLAAQAGDWPAAETHWRAIVTQAPQVGWAWGPLAEALHRQGREAEAEQALAAARDANPDHYDVAAAWARQPATGAQARQDTDRTEAARRWADVRARFPAEPDAWWQAGIALREAGRPEEARALLTEACDRFPGNPNFWHDLARLAEARQDHAEAEHRWRGYVALEPGAWFGWLGVAGAAHAQGRVAEAEAMLLKGLEDFPDVHVFVHIYAEWARNRRDWPEAERRATLLAARFPAAWEGLWGQALAAREQGRTEEALALLLRGAAQHPNAGNYAHDLARLAEQRRDWPEAERWWRRFIPLHPDLWWAHAGLANALREQGQDEAAEAVLLAAHERDPTQPAFLAEYGRLAERRGDRTEAKRRFDLLLARFPDAPDGPLGLAMLARDEGRPEEAEELLQRGHARNPGAPAFAEHLAKFAEARGDWLAAATWWQAFVQCGLGLWWAHRGLAVAWARADRAVEADAAYAEARRLFPADELIPIGYIAALIDTGRRAEARTLIRQLLDRTPAPSADGLLHCGLLAVACEDWDDAIESALRLKAGPRPPNAGQFENVLRSRLTEVDPARLQALDKVASVDAADDTKSLLMRFESLGGDYPGCEIGLIQRRLGADPLGLLRWTTTPLDKLVQAMESEFAGVGTGDQTKIYIAPTGEYKTQDLVFYMDMVTFVRPSDCDEATMRSRSIKRISYLRGKLIEDLTDASKVFVYRSLQDRHGLPDIQRLKAAMGRFGPNMLLYLRLADDQHPVGSCEIINWDLVIGYVAKFSIEPVAVLYPEGWREVFQAAEAHWTLMRQFADQPIALVRAQAARLRDQEPAEARALLLQARRQAPDDSDLQADLGELAARVGDWPQAEACWRAVLAQRPDLASAQAGLAQALNAQGNAAAADALLSAAEQANPQDLATGLAWARHATDAADWPEAARRWTLLQARFSAEVDPWWHAGAALREAGLPDQARTMLLAGAERFPTHAAFAHDLARLAEAGGDWAEAERWWRVFIDLHPQMWWAHTGLANALREQQRVAEAEAALLAAAAALPAQAEILLEHARMAERRGDWVEASHRYNRMAAACPDAWEAMVGQATALREQARLAEAETILLAGHARHPAIAAFADQLARLAQQRHDWPQAVHWWQEVLHRDPGHWGAWLFLARVYIQCGDLEKAEQTYRESRLLFPAEEVLSIAYVDALLGAQHKALALPIAQELINTPPPPSPRALLCYGHAAVLGEDWEAALKCALMLRSAPRSPLVTRFEATLRSRLAEIDPTRVHILDDWSQQAADSDTDMFTRFESLGGDNPGCEIGLVQRQFGAEPLGLLRWTTTPLPALIEALEADLEGVGSPTQTDVYITPGGEYKTRDKRFHMDMLTFVRPTDVEPDLMRKRSLKRIGFLKNKLIDDLREGSKIFVYRSYEDRYSVPEIIRLKQAMSRFGRNRLLYLRLASDNHAVGSIEIAAPDLMIGYVEQFSFRPNDNLYLEGWIEVFRAAHAQWPAAAPATEPAAALATH